MAHPSTCGQTPHPSTAARRQRLDSASLSLSPSLSLSLALSVQDVTCFRSQQIATTTNLTRMRARIQGSYMVVSLIDMSRFRAVSADGTPLDSGAARGRGVDACRPSQEPPPHVRLPRPTPYTLHPTPYIIHPTPNTQHPTPYTTPKFPLEGAGCRVQGAACRVNEPRNPKHPAINRNPYTEPWEQRVAGGGRSAARQKS